MKVAPLHRAFKKYHDKIQHVIVHTGQHYDQMLSDVFFKDLDLPQPDYSLGIGSESHARQTAKIMIEFEKVLLAESPELVIVVGDVNSTLGCAIVSAKMGISVAHVEAGLRSFDRTMPEEINRILTDIVSDFLFVTEQSGVENLKKEGVPDSKIYLVGNVMIDSLLYHRAQIRKSTILTQFNLKPNTFTLVTLHRPSNVDSREGLRRIIQIMKSLSERSKIVFPIHPRSRKMLDHHGLSEEISSINNLTLVDPLGYLDFQKLLENASLVITDSGGIQEETTFLSIPCLTLRENTERPITVEIGTNELCGNDVSLVIERSLEIFKGVRKQGSVPYLWDGKASERIAAIVVNSN